MVQVETDELPLDEHLNLLLRIDNVACDETRDPTSHPDQCDLPPWYNETLYKRGQQFYRYNIFAIFVANLCGLISVLAIPAILNILIMTKQSSTVETAYRRYVGTILHMHKWYMNEFKPGSEIWKSLSEVRHRHNSASRRSAKTGASRVTQRDMALTQFGFIGFILAEPKKLGIQFPEYERDIEGFVHFWRVIGWMLGIEDKYNLCRSSASETVQLCQDLNSKLMGPSIRKTDEDFVQMYRVLIEAMWFVNPLIYINSFMTFLFNLTNCENYRNENFEISTPKLKLTDFEIRINNMMTYLLRYLFEYNLIRLYFNYQIMLSVFLIQYFPFLAFAVFGIKKSYVKLYEYVKR